LANPAWALRSRPGLPQRRPRLSLRAVVSDRRIEIAQKHIRSEDRQNNIKVTIRLIRDQFTHRDGSPTTAERKQLT
jgi:hypothetical protein